MTSRDDAGGFTTRAVHSTGYRPVEQVPTSVPIFQTSTWRHESGEAFAEVINGKVAGYAYGRGYGNPTVEAFESVVAALERTEAAFAYSSGMAAIHAICTTLAQAGDRIVASRELYGGTYSLFASLLPRYGIDVQIVDPYDLDAVAATIRGAAMFYVETIANPSCTVADLPALAELCAEAGVPTVVDNTFASPYLCNPATFGYDFVLHSATKTIAGHSDVVAGVVCASAADRARLRSVTLDSGGAIAPFDAWLSLRGVETLELRMERHCSNAMALATYLESHPAVSAVHYPGLTGHPHHERAATLFRPGLFGGMLAFEMDGGIETAAAWCDSLGIGWIGASLGGTHTLVCHPASSTHRQMPPEARAAAGLPDGLIRVSPGIENIEDLLADFGQALDKV